jgi:hypothetical protein
MTTPGRKPISDDDLDALLGRRLKATTREFDARWETFLRRLRTEPASRHAIPPWAAWLGLMSAGVTLAAILLALHPWRPAPPPPGPVPDLDILFTMDAALEPATALLDGETRDALLNLPTDIRPST